MRSTISHMTVTALRHVFAMPTDWNFLADVDFIVGKQTVVAMLRKREVGRLEWYDDGEIEWVHVDPAFRHKGLAAAMLTYARSVDPSVHHSEVLTDDGSGWSQSVGSLASHKETVMTLTPDELRRLAAATEDAPDEDAPEEAAPEEETAPTAPSGSPKDFFFLPKGDPAAALALIQSEVGGVAGETPVPGGVDGVADVALPTAKPEQGDLCPSCGVGTLLPKDDVDGIEKVAKDYTRGGNAENPGQFSAQDKGYDKDSIPNKGKSKGGDSGSGKAEETAEGVGAKGLAAAMADGGFSMRDPSGNGPQGGYMIALDKGTEFTVDMATLTADDIAAYYEKHADLLADDSKYLGGWVEDGKLYLDISTNMQDQDEVMNLARQNDQIAVWDVANSASVYTDQYFTKDQYTLTASQLRRLATIEPCENCGSAAVSSVHPPKEQARGMNLPTTVIECDECGTVNDGDLLYDSMDDFMESYEHGTDYFARMAASETRLPAEVDTLRDDSCPVCGSVDYRGEKCNACGYIKPPVVFHDPNTQKPDLDSLRTPKVEVDLACDSCGAVFPAGGSEDAPAPAPAPAPQVTARIHRSATIPSPPPLPSRTTDSDGDLSEGDEDAGEEVETDA